MKVLKFYADWCQPCKMLTRTLEDVKTDIPVEEIDIETAEGSELAQKFGLRGVPTMVMVDDNGVEVKRKVGMAMANELETFFNVKE